MNEKRSSTLLLILALAVGAVVAWYGLGALWHLLLRMHGRG